MLPSFTPALTLLRPGFNLALREFRNVSGKPSEEKESFTNIQRKLTDLKVSEKQIKTELVPMNVGTKVIDSSRSNQAIKRRRRS